MATKKNYSLLTRLTLWYILSTFLLVASTSVYLYWSLVSTLEQKDAHLLSDRLQTIRLLLGAGDNLALRARVETEWVNRKYERLYVTVHDATGKVIAATPDVSATVADLFAQLKSARTDGSPAITSFSYPSDETVFRTMTSPLIPNGPGAPYSVKLVLDRSNEEKVLALHRQRLYVVLLVTALLCIWTGRRLAARAVEPINGMAATAARIRSSTLHERMADAEMPVELGRLAVTLNGMMDRIEDSFDRLSRFGADLAHELRTPISNLVGELEVALGRQRDEKFYRDAIGSALEECQHLAHIIDSLLFLARADEPSRQLKKEKISLRNELASVLEFYDAAALEAGLHLALQNDAAIEIEVEKTLFHRAIGNVVANAIRHAKDSGQLTIATKTAGRQVAIEITDRGQGIPAQHLPRLFDRFYRVDESRTKDSGGTGLGLAIVRSIAAIHGGKVEIESKVGFGTTVRIFFPLSHPPASVPS